MLIFCPRYMINAIVQIHLFVGVQCFLFSFFYSFLEQLWITYIFMLHGPIMINKQTVWCGILNYISVPVTCV